MRCQAFIPAGPNPPWTRCTENATHSIAFTMQPTTSLFIRCCEEHWNELRADQPKGGTDK